MTYKLMVKQNGETEMQFERDNEMLVEQQLQTFLAYAESQDWKATTLNNGKTLLKRGDDKMYLWVQAPDGAVVR